jgi:hypothetical protein
MHLWHQNNIKNINNSGEFRGEQGRYLLLSNYIESNYKYMVYVMQTKNEENIYGQDKIWTN